VQHKIVSPSSIPHTQKVVLCQGCFDLLHIGHIKHLSAAKQYGDILVVAVTSDRYVNKGPGRPYFNQDLRMEMLAALEIVDYVVLSDNVGAEGIIREVRPDFFVKGDEYETSKLDVVDNMTSERAAVESVGGQVVFTHDQVFSSSEIINKVFSPLTPEVRSFIQGGSVTKDLIIKALEDIKKLKVLVIGDAILDEYCFIKPTGMATKQSCLSAKFLSNEIQLGGAIATARHIGKLCDNVTLLTTVDSIKAYMIQEEIKNVSLINLEVSDSQVIHKTRFIDENNRILFHVNFGDDSQRDHKEEILSYVLSNDWDVVVVNDFGHGMINRDTAAALSAANQFFCVNTQTNNMNKGNNFITKYSRADYISIDLPEARLATNSPRGTLDEMATQLRQLIPHGTLSITRGKEGASIYQQGVGTYIPAFSVDVVDTTGAGDSYFAATSLLVAAGINPGVVGFIGNAVASLKTRIIGNREAIDPVLLKKYLIALVK
jgi:rfaE bifunctional protein nucleotidyltransferase chain/domain